MGEEQLWGMFAAAALAGGKSTKDASSAADSMTEQYARRFPDRFHAYKDDEHGLC